MNATVSSEVAAVNLQPGDLIVVSAVEPGKTVLFEFIRGENFIVPPRRIPVQQFTDTNGFVGLIALTHGLKAELVKGHFPYKLFRRADTIFKLV